MGNNFIEHSNNKVLRTLYFSVQSEQSSHTIKNFTEGRNR